MAHILEPGIYPDISAAEYHADPVVDVPSLSASVAKELVRHTPFHAWLKHPRLNADWRKHLGLENETNGASRFGTVAHELLLGRGAGIHIIQAKDKEGNPVRDYRTKAAQEERDSVVALGVTPCLQHELDQAEDLVELVVSQVERIPGCERAFKSAHGRGEVTVISRDHLGVFCRALVDWWGEDGTVYDLKTSTTDLSDEALQRKIDNDDLDLRAAFYLRAIGLVRPDLMGRIPYRFVFVQQKAPFELRVVELDKATLAQGHKKVAFAIARWAHHLKTGQWPGYPPRIEVMTVPRWSSDRWVSREENDPTVRAAILSDPVVSAFTTPSNDASLTEIAS